MPKRSKLYKAEVTIIKGEGKVAEVKEQSPGLIGKLKKKVKGIQTFVKSLFPKQEEEKPFELTRDVGAFQAATKKEEEIVEEEAFLPSGKPFPKKFKKESGKKLKGTPAFQEFKPLPKAKKQEELTKPKVPEKGNEKVSDQAAKKKEKPKEAAHTSGLEELLKYGFTEEDLAKLEGIQDLEGVQQEELESKPFVCSFQDVKAHIQKNYPDFKIDKLTDIKQFQEAGTPLHFAAGKVEVVETVDESKAVLKSDLKLLKLLIGAGADIQQLDKGGNTFYTILSHSIRKSVVISDQHREVIEQLLIQKAPIHIGSNEGQSLLKELVLKVRGDDASWVSAVLSKVIEVHGIESFYPIALAILENGDLPNKLLDNLLEKGLDINAKDDVGRTLLFRAVDQGNTELVSFLKERGANPSEERNVGEQLGANTPLELANEKLAAAKRFASKNIPGMEMRASEKVRSAQAVVDALVA